MIDYRTTPAGRAVRTTATILALSAAPQACVQRDGDRTCQTISDSAGVAIATIDCSAESLPQWHAEVALTIGEVHGPAELTFGQISDIAVDRHARLLVLDRQAQDVRLFDRDGSLVRRIGGPGDGPGELGAYPTTVRVGPGDSIYVLDNMPPRLHVYSPGGDPVRTVFFRLEKRRGPYDVHVLPDGGFLLRWYTYHLSEDGRFLPWDVLLRGGPANSSWDSVMAFVYEPPDVGDVNEIKRPLISNTAFYDLLAEQRVAWSAIEDDQVYLHTLNGDLSRIIRNASWRRAATTDADRAVFAQVFLASQDGEVRSMSPNVTYPDSIPTIITLRASPDGGFWVQRMSALTELDPDGLMDPVNSRLLGGGTWEVYNERGML